MDHGIAGGSLKSQEAQAAAVGELAVRVLNGEQADSIPLAREDLGVSQVDWRQLRRWGIDEARVPAGTLIRYRERSIWDRYKVYIGGAVALLLAQAALIAGLLLQADRRRRAENQVRSREQQLRATYERIRYLGQRLLAAREEEHSRIARELHDDVSQQLAVLVFDLHLLSRGDPDRPTATEAETEALVSHALTCAEAVAGSLRNLSHRLHPATLRLLGLVSALDGLANDMSRAETSIVFSHENVPAGIAYDVALCLFRVAQEALHNAIKHGEATIVSVHLKGVDDRLVMTVTDDGRGFDVHAVRHCLGLISMEERMEQVGGSFAIRSTPGGGTQLEVVSPARTDEAMDVSAT
jgi:signal transduction histidine kinase